MNNPYQEMKKIARKQHAKREVLLHALMATIYTNCCDNCSEKFRSKDFMKAFSRMVKDIQVTRDLSKKPQVA